MIDLRLFRDPLFSISLMTGFLVFIVVAGMFVLPFYLELVKGYRSGAGRPVSDRVPGGVGPARADSPGRSPTATDSRGISLIGLDRGVIGCLTTSTLTEHTSTLGYIVRLLPVGSARGFSCRPTTAPSWAPPRATGWAWCPGCWRSRATFGQVTGLPLIGAIFASRVLSVAHISSGAGVDAGDAPPWAIVAGLHTAFVVAAVLIGVGVLLAGYAFMIDWRRRRG